MFTKQSRMMTVCRAALWLAVLTAWPCARAATTALLDWNAEVLRTQGQSDPFYSASTHSGAFSVLGTSGTVGVLSGRNFRQSPGEDPYGIILPGMTMSADQRGIGLVKGLAPDGPGQTQRTLLLPSGTQVVDASYIQLVLHPRQDSLFTRFILDMTKARFVGAEANIAWVGVFQGESMITATNVMTHSQHEDGMTAFQWHLEYFEALSSPVDPVSLRVYGLLGDDIGFIEALQLTIEETPLLPIPEPMAPGLMMAGLLAVWRRRR
jgi:hypothetical protein